jgi:hypothetical protein
MRGRRGRTSRRSCASAAHDGRAGVRRAQALEKQVGVRAGRAGVAHEEDLLPLPCHPGQRPMVGGGHPEEVRVGREAVLEDDGIGIAELHPLRGKGEGEPDRPQKPLRQREGEQQPARQQGQVRAEMAQAPERSPRAFHAVRLHRPILPRLGSRAQLRLAECTARAAGAAHGLRPGAARAPERPAGRHATCSIEYRGRCGGARRCTWR